MSRFVLNPEDRFSRDAAHMAIVSTKEDGQTDIWTDKPGPTFAKTFVGGALINTMISN